MAFDINIFSADNSGKTLVARLFRGGSQQGSDIALSEMGSTGHFYKLGQSLSGRSNGVHAILIYNTTDSVYVDDVIGEVNVKSEMTYEDWMVQQAENTYTDTQNLWTDLRNTGRLDEIFDAIKAKTDQLDFVGTDVKATLDGETVETDTASRNASKADVSALATTSQLNSQTSYLETHGDTNWSTATPPSESQIADAVWDELVSGHMTPGTFGYALYSAVVYGGQNGAWLELLLKYHNNKVVFFEADGTTETTQGDAYFMTVYDDDGTTVLKRIEFKDAAGDPAKLSLATNYIKT